MNKHYLMSKMKSTGTAYLCWFLLGCHYAYLGKWGLQIVYWLSIGGLGIWAFIDLFHIPTKVRNQNLIVSKQIDDIEKREKADQKAENLAMINAMKS